MIGENLKIFRAIYRPCFVFFFQEHSEIIKLKKINLGFITLNFGIYIKNRESTLRRYCSDGIC